MIKAESEVGSISSFQYQAPSGMICTQKPSLGQTDCEWTMTPEQLQVDSHSFCWDATDSLGLVAERRCLTIKVFPHNVQSNLHIFRASAVKSRTF